MNWNLVGQYYRSFPHNAKFQYVFTRIHCWFLFWIGEISSRPSHSICIRNILISSFYLYLGLHSDLFTSCFQNKSVWIYVLSHSLHKICPYFAPWFEYHNNLWWGNQTRWEKCQTLRIFQQLGALNPTYTFKMKVTQIPRHVQIRTKVGHKKQTHRRTNDIHIRAPWVYRVIHFLSKRQWRFERKC
jgi:hypothetical protein